MAPHSNDFGPWAAGLTVAERIARVRSLHAIIHLCCGPRSADLCRLLALAEHEDAALEPAARALDHLDPLDFRRVLSTYAALHRAVLAA